MFYLATAVTIALIAFFAGIALAPHLKLYWATRDVKTPFGLAFDPAGIADYITSTSYTWRPLMAVLRSDTAVFLGELKRGFGLSYRIRWSPGTDELLSESIHLIRFRFYTHHRCSRSTLSGFSPEDKSVITKAILAKMGISPLIDCMTE